VKKEQESVAKRALEMATCSTAAAAAAAAAAGACGSKKQKTKNDLRSLSASASGCEQNWSSFGYVHNDHSHDSQNRLTTKHASVLVWL